MCQSLLAGQASPSGSGDRKHWGCLPSRELVRRFAEILYSEEDPGEHELNSEVAEISAGIKDVTRHVVNVHRWRALSVGVSFVKATQVEVVVEGCAAFDKQDFARNTGVYCVDLG